jgi:hypothetical protein
MKKYLLFFLICSSFSSMADFWTQKAAFPGGIRQIPTSFTVGNKGYVYGGFDGNSLSDVWEFDPALNVWIQKADLPSTARSGAVGFSIGNKGYVGTGSYLSDFWEYDPALNTWTQKSNFGGGNRDMAVGFAIGNKGYLGLGGNGTFSDFWEWDQLTDTWTQKNFFPGIPRGYLQGYVINGKGYIATGYDGQNTLNDNWQYDPVTDTWTQMADLPAAARMDASAFAICEKGYLGTGGELPFYDDFWQFDPVLNQWLQKANVPGGLRDDCAYFSIGAKGYIGLGQLLGSTYALDFWEYTPDSADCFISALFSAPQNLCPGTCTNFTNLSFNATSYQWSFPGAIPSSSTDTTPENICYANPGNYDVQLIAANSIGSDTILLANYITIYPYPSPQGILQNGDTLFAIAGSSSYQWYFNGNIIPGATNYFYVATASGDYNMIATDTNGCEVEAVINNVLAHTPLAVGYWPLAIYPNPVTSTIDIRGLENNSVDEINIFSVFGKIIFSADHCQLPIVNCQLSSGIYYIEITSDKKTYRTKFVKQ